MFSVTVYDTMLRADCGAENSLVGTIQLALRSLHLDQWHDKAIRKSRTNSVMFYCMYVAGVTQICSTVPQFVPA